MVKEDLEGKDKVASMDKEDLMGRGDSMVKVVLVDKEDREVSIGKEELPEAKDLMVVKDLTEGKVDILEGMVEVKVIYLQDKIHTQSINL